MIDFSAISQGFNERQDYNRNKRLDVMKLFEEFKRNNPEATMADFQSFRDQVSGGRNYLKGGVGNDAALKRIVDTNERKRAAAAAAQAQAADIQKLEFLTKLQPYVENELLNMNPMSGDSPNQPEYDYAGAANNIKNMFGGSMPFDLDLTNMLSEGNRSRAVQSKVLTMLPQARTYINSLTDPTQANAGELSSLLQVPQGVAKQLLKSAQDEFNTAESEKVRELGFNITDRVNEMSKEEGMTFDAVKKALDERYGDDPIYNKWKGKSLDGLQTTFDIRAKNVKQAKAEEFIIKLNGIIDNNKSEMLAILNSKGETDGKAALKALLSRNLTETEIAGVTDKYLTGEIDDLMSAMRTVQDDSYATKAAAQAVTNTKLEADELKAAEDRIAGALGASEGRFGKDAELLDIANRMAKQFQIDSQAITIMGSVAENIPQDATYADKQKLMYDALAQSGQRTFAEYISDRKELSSAKFGVLEPQNFKTYYDSRKTAADEIILKITDYGGLIEQISQRAASPEDKIRALRKLKDRTADEIKHFSEINQRDRQSSIGSINGETKNYTWLDPSQPWDDQKMTDLTKSLSRIDRQIEAEMLAQRKLITSPTLRPRSRPANATVAAGGVAKGIRPRKRPDGPLAADIETSLRPIARPAVVEEAPIRKAFLDPDYQFEITQDRNEEMDQIASNIWNRVKDKVSDMFSNSDGAKLDKELMEMLGFTTKEQLDDWKAKQ